MSTTASSNTDVPCSGLSEETDSTDFPTRDPLNDLTGANTLFELDNALLHVAGCMKTLRERVEACKRQRELLDTCIRANLCQMPDGQFTQMKDDKDRYQMLANIMQADHDFADANANFHIAFTKTLNGLRIIGEQNSLITLWRT
jgi:hypothetical protein